jgi:probable phosphoglycerate mutase
MREAQLRAVEGIESVVLDHPRQTVAIVSHSDIIKMIVAHYLGLHLDLFQRITIAPASLTILQLRSGAAQLELLNETGYLPQETPPAAPNP